MSGTEWLASIKAGDAVLVPTRYGRDFNKGTVAKITATQFVVNMGTQEHRFRRSDGRSIGLGSHSTTWLAEPTPERLEEAVLRGLKNKVRTMINSLAIPEDRQTLEALVAAIRPFVKA